MNTSQKMLAGTVGITLYSITTLSLMFSNDEKHRTIGLYMGLAGGVAAMAALFISAGKEDKESNIIENK